MLIWRRILIPLGIVVALIGAAQLLVEVAPGDLVILALWMILAVLIHDGLLSPVVIAVGWFLARHVPPRARRYLQAGLVAAGLVTVVALPMIYRSRTNDDPSVKALLLQDFGANLTLLLGLVGATSLVVYAIRVARDTRGR